MENSFLKLFLTFLTFLFLQPLSSFSQLNQDFDIELVESIPVETSLDNPDIRNTQEVWLEMINSAQKTLDIEQFYISNKDGEALDTIIKAIIAAGERGVRIRVIVDAKMYNTYPETVDMLKTKKNIEIGLFDVEKIFGGIQHSKFIIADSVNYFIGSQNFDWRALSHIHELGIHFKGKFDYSDKNNPNPFRFLNDSIIKKFNFNIFSEWYLHLFNYDFHIVKDLPSPLARYNILQLNEMYTFNTISYDTVRLFPCISPVVYREPLLWEDIYSIIKIIANSKTELLLQFLTYNPYTKDSTYWGEIDSTIINAANRGVKVKLIVSDWCLYEPALSHLKYLSSIPNIEVKYTSIPDWSGGYIPYARVEHCKFIISDNKTFWLGSSNMEKSYFYNSRNVGIVVENDKLSSQVRDIFYKSWDSEYAHQIAPDGNYTPREHGER